MRPPLFRQGEDDGEPPLRQQVQVADNVAALVPHNRIFEERQTLTLARVGFLLAGTSRSPRVQMNWRYQWDRRHNARRSANMQPIALHIDTFTVTQAIVC